jgi:hypothetical protein
MIEMVEMIEIVRRRQEEMLMINILEEWKLKVELQVQLDNEAGCCM